MSARTVLAALLFAASAVACAAEEDAGPTEGRFDDQTANRTPVPVPSGDAGTDSASKGSATGGGFSDDDSKTDPDAGPNLNAPVDGGAAPDSGNTTPTTNTCKTARDLGAIAGDDGNATVSAQGTCTEWVKIRAEEKVGGIIPSGMKLKITLGSPNAENFDLFAYVNKDADLVECTTATAQSEEPTGRSDVTALTWGEGYIGNQSLDTRTVSILVKNKTGGCDATKSWSLVIQGNQE